MFHLGVAAKIVGIERARPPAAAHLSVKLLALRDVLLYLAQRAIHCYRLPADLIDLNHTQPFDEQTRRDCDGLLHEVGELARHHAIRLTMHLPLHAALATPDEAIAERAATLMLAHARLLDALGCGADGVLVAHAGGFHGDRRATLDRFAVRWERLPTAARCRIVIEPDEDCFDLAALLPLHQITGAPLVFDALHFQINNPHQIALPEALALALATWPFGTRPKIHMSSQRTEAHLRAARAGSPHQIVPPRHGQHADFINPFEFAALLRAMRGLPACDIMLEAKAADMALLRLRDDVRRFAPDLAPHLDERGNVMQCNNHV